MTLAQAAVIRAPLFHRLRPDRCYHPVGIAFCPGKIAFQGTFPDEGTEAAVLPALLFHVDIAIVPYHLFRRNFGKADRADRHSFSDFH